MKQHTYHRVINVLKRKANPTGKALRYIVPTITIFFCLEDALMYMTLPHTFLSQNSEISPFPLCLGDASDGFLPAATASAVRAPDLGHSLSCILLLQAALESE